jgi:predicted acetyltransferase
MLQTHRYPAAESVAGGQPERRFQKVRRSSKKAIGQDQSSQVAIVEVTAESLLPRTVLTRGTYNRGMALAQGLPMLSNGNLQLELLSVEPHPVHKVQTYFFRMLDTRSGDEAGRINLRLGSGTHIERYAGHIGYFVEPEHRGHAYSARALRLLRNVARQLGVDPIWITCDPDNIPSRRACERAGAEFVEIVDVPVDCTIYQNGHQKKCRYRLPSSD